MNRRPLYIAIIICVSLFLGAVVVPLSLHTLSLRQLHNAVFSAVRFAAEKDPGQLSALPVSRWREESRQMPASIYRTGWEQFEMRIPRGNSTVIAHIDLRSTVAPLFLGAGGWLRVLLGIAASGLLSWWGIGRLTDSEKSAAPSRATPVGDANTVKPDSDGTLLASTLDLVSHAAVIFNRHHHVVTWNAALQRDIGTLAWQPGLHLLDIAERLQWGSTLLEKIDDAVAAASSEWSTILAVRKGETLCVLLG